MPKEIFLPSVRKREAPHRGKTSSRDWNSFQDEVIRDLSTVAKSLNNISSRYEKRVLALEQEIRVLGAGLSYEKKKTTRDNDRAAALGTNLAHDQGFIDLSNLLFTDVAEARRLRVEPQFGQITTPFNKVVSRIYSLAPTTRELYIPDSLGVTVTPVDEGTSGLIWADQPSLSVDGRVGEGYLRRVAFDQAVDLEAVTMDVIIDIPSLYASQANFLTLYPSPSGQVDVLNIWYSTTSAAATTALPGFSAQYGVYGVRHHFAPLSITKIRVRLRQRHWAIEDTEKVFTYGIKELNLDLVDLDKTNSGSGWRAADNLAIFKIDAPSGYTFDTLKGFTSNPVWATGGSDNGIYFRIFEEEALSNAIWDSFTDTALVLETTGSHIDISSSTLSSIYVAVNLAYVAATNTSPVLEDFSLVYTVA